MLECTQSSAEFSLCPFVVTVLGCGSRTVLHLACRSCVLVRVHIGSWDKSLVIAIKLSEKNKPETKLFCLVVLFKLRNKGRSST